MNTAKAASVFISHKRSKSPGGSSCLPPSKPAFQVKSSAEPRVIYRLSYTIGLRLSLYNGCLSRKTPPASGSSENFPQRPY
jgi:hypothetical protein